LVINKDIPLPDTYRGYFLELMPDLGEGLCKGLAEGVTLRNILCHHYLDIKWLRIERFLKHWRIYEQFLDKLHSLLFV
jgi:uncharacterized protein YutE (UPF0331/DUF86 family)